MSTMSCENMADKVNTCNRNRLRRVCFFLELLLHSRWLWFSAILNMAYCSEEVNSSLCAKDEYYDSNTHMCSSCADVCRPRPDRSTDIACQLKCPEYLKQKNKGDSLKDETMTGSSTVMSADEPGVPVHGEENALWKKPLFWTSVISVSISIVASVVLIVLCTCKKVRTMAPFPGRRPVRPPQVQLTQESSKNRRELVTGNLLNETEAGDLHLESCNRFAPDGHDPLRVVLCDPSGVSAPMDTDLFYGPDPVVSSRQSSIFREPKPLMASSLLSSTDSGLEDSCANLKISTVEDSGRTGSRTIDENPFCNKVFDAKLHSEVPDEPKEKKSFINVSEISQMSVPGYSSDFEGESFQLSLEEEESSSLLTSIETGDDRKRHDQDLECLWKTDSKKVLDQELECTQQKLPKDSLTKSADGTMLTCDPIQVEDKSGMILSVNEYKDRSEDAILKTKKKIQGCHYKTVGQITARSGKELEGASSFDEKPDSTDNQTDTEENKVRTEEFSVLVSCIIFDQSSSKQSELNFINGLNQDLSVHKLKELFHVKVREVWTPNGDEKSMTYM